MKVFVYRKCSTCMKALKWLEAHNVEFEERAIKEENPTYEELKEWYTMSGLQLVIRQIKRCRFHQIKTGLSEHLTMG